jgi:hypothetical protein
MVISAFIKASGAAIGTIFNTSEDDFVNVHFLHSKFMSTLKANGYKDVTEHSHGLEVSIEDILTAYNKSNHFSNANALKYLAKGEEASTFERQSLILALAMLRDGLPTLIWDTNDGVCYYSTFDGKDLTFVRAILLGVYYQVSSTSDDIANQFAGDDGFTQDFDGLAKLFRFEELTEKPVWESDGIKLEDIPVHEYAPQEPSINRLAKAGGLKIAPVRVTHSKPANEEVRKLSKGAQTHASKAMQALQANHNDNK